MNRSRVAPFLLAVLPSVLCAQTLPLDYFTRSDDFRDVALSPDGGFFAASTLVKGADGIAIYRIQPLESVTAVRAREGMAIEQFQWTSSTRLAYSVAQRGGGTSDSLPANAIYAIDRDGGEPLAIYGYGAGAHQTGVGWTLAVGEMVRGGARDDGRILVSEYELKESRPGWVSDPDSKPTLSWIYADTGKKTVLASLPLASAQPVMDGFGHVLFATGYNTAGQYAVMWTRYGEWQPFDVPGFRTATLRPRHITPDARAVLFTGARIDDALSALYRMDLETREVTQLYADSRGDIDEVVTDLAGTTAIGVRVDADRPEYHWLDAEQPTAKLYQMLERAFPGQAARITSASRDQHFAIALVQSDVNPGDYYLIDTQTRKADLLVPSRSWVDPARMRHKESVTLQARDGLVLHGYVTRPRDGAGPYPLVVLPHGNFSERDRWYFDSEVQMFAHYGYAVLQVNYRGSDGYGEDFLRAGYGEWGDKMQDDITDATRWAIDHGIAEKGNICIYGTGSGGYVALMGAVREPTLYQCAASSGGITDWRLSFKSAGLRGSAASRFHLNEMVGGNGQFLHDRSPINYAGRIEVPILLMHAGNDPDVSYANATRMRDALEEAGKRVELVTLKDSGRGELDDEQRLATYQKLLDFLAFHLRGMRADADAKPN